MNVTSEELINLVLTPMSDDKMIETIDALGLEQPTITEEYEEEKAVYVEDPDNTGVVFTFKELDGYSKTGEPCLVKIDFMKNDIIKFPYDLKPSDNYQICCEKLGRKADYLDKWLKKSKIWLVTLPKSKKIVELVIHFTNKDFDMIRCVVINYFNESAIGKTLIPNKD